MLDPVEWSKFLTFKQENGFWGVVRKIGAAGEKSTDQCKHRKYIFVVGAAAKWQLYGQGTHRDPSNDPLAV